MLYYYACSKLIIVNKIVNLVIFLKNSLIHLIQVTKVKKKSFNGFYDPRLHAKSDGKSIQKDKKKISCLPAVRLLLNGTAAGSSVFYFYFVFLVRFRSSVRW